MKTRILTMATLALLMAGCSQNEVTEINPDASRAMEFDAYTGVHTRVETTDASMKEDPADDNKYGGFGIMAYYTGTNSWADGNTSTTTAPNFMHNQLVKWNTTTSKWTYEPLKYWPNNTADKISFFAYAPYEADWENGTKTGITLAGPTEAGTPAVTFVLNKKNDLKKMVDLVVANAKDQSYASTNGTGNGKVKFAFDHTLCRLGFQVKLGNGDFTGMDGTKSFIYVTNMWIVGKNHGTTAEQGNLSLLYPAAASNSGSKFYTKGTWANEHWNYDQPAQYEIPDKDYSLNGILNVDAGINYSTLPAGHTNPLKGVKVDKDAQTTPVKLFADGDYLYLIPVGDNASGGTGCAEGDIKVGFHYDIVSQDATDPTKYIATHTESVISIQNTHLKRKESYMYTLKINLHAIEIESVSVKPWNDQPINSDVN